MRAALYFLWTFNLIASTIFEGFFKEAVVIPQIIGQSSSFREMVNFVAAYVSDDDFKTLNENGRRRLKRLYGEVRKGEAVLELDPKTKNIDRYACNVRGILYDRDTCKYLREESRSFNGENITAKNRNDVWSISETVLPRERSIECLQRGLLQEMGLKITIPQLERRAKFDRFSFSHHNSSVYPGIKSYVLSTWYHVDVTGLKLTPRTRDNGIIHKWIWCNELAAVRG